MIPNTDYPEKATSMADLVARLGQAPERLALAVAGLTPDECEAHPFADEKSVRECAEHVACVSLGWTDHFFEAIEDLYESPRAATRSRAWCEPLEAEARASLAAALAVYRRHNAFLATFLARLPDADFGRPFKRVAWLTEPFLIRESINWGCVLHCDWHLGQIQRKREVFGKPLPWLETYAQRWPAAVKGHVPRVP